MNISRTNAASYFSFDEGASGTGGASPPAPGGGAVAQPSPSSSVPEPTPSSGSAPGSDPAPALGSDPFSGLDGGFEDDLDEVILPDTPPTDGGVPAQPSVKAPAPATPAAPVATAPAPQEPAAPAPPPAPAATSASPGARLDEVIDGFKANSLALAQHAGETLFKLSDEDATALVTNAETVIPRLMGQVYTQSIAAAGNLMRNFIPMMIEAVIEQQHNTRTKSVEAVGEFYKAHPDLNEKDHGDLVTSWAKAFRAANPKATRAEAIAYVGQAVRIQRGMAPPKAPATAARPAPFAPARPGGRQAPASQENDPFAMLDPSIDIE